MGFLYTAAIGLIMVVFGFSMMKTRRTMEDIPTSKIATGAVGANVEIKGRIAHNPKELHTAPISGKKCVYYSFTILKYSRSKVDGKVRGRQLYRYKTHNSLYIEDKSRAHALVYLAGANLSFLGGSVVYQIEANDLENMKGRLKKWLKENPDKHKNFDIHYKEPGLFGGQNIKYEFIEQSFSPKDEIYIMGYANPGTDLNPSKIPPIPVSNRKVSFKMFNKARKIISSSSQLAQRFDTNQDGILSDEELQTGAKTLGEEMEEQRSKGLSAPSGHSVKMVFKNQKDQPLIVSNKTERAVGEDYTGGGLQVLIVGALAFIGGIMGFLYFKFIAFT